MNLGGIYKELGNLDQALACTLKSLELKPDNPDSHMNLGGIYKDLGNLDQALACTLKSLELKPDNPDTHMNLGAIYKDLGNFDQALASTLKSLELKPDNPTAHNNLGGIYKELSNLDQALASTLKSLELKPDNPDALSNLSLIQATMGDIEKSAESLQRALSIEPHNPEVLFQSSLTLKDTHDAYSLLKIAIEAGQEALPPKARSLVEFAKSNCFHKIKDYKNATKLLIKANKSKLSCMPSEAAVLIKAIQINSKTSTKHTAPTSKQTCDQVFIVGVPRSGSTLLSAILNTNPLTKDIGESTALPKALSIYLNQEMSAKKQNLRIIYRDCISEEIPEGSIILDKQLYNFMHCQYISNHMLGAKAIHATRNPLDNILSMLRANLRVHNNYTSSAEDSAKVIIEQELSMRSFKKSFPSKIYSYSYDRLVMDPKPEIQKILAWLGWDWSDSYLSFYKNKQIINTTSVLQARQPISNKSVGGWRNYSSALEQARQILLESNLFSTEDLKI